MTTSVPKQAVAELINTWIDRSRLQKQDVAALAGFLDYNEFYHSYLNLKRNLNTDPRAAVAVVRAFTSGLPSDRRCTASEAIQFFVLTSLPLDRYEQVRQLNLFPTGEWQAAIKEYLPSHAFVAPSDAVESARPAPPAAVDSRSIAAAQFAQLTAGDDPPPIAALPRPHRMPLGRNPLFCGRVDDLRLLAQLVAHHAAADGRAVAITGLGGMGKTNLATEFVHRYGQYFAGGVFWINCADPGAVALEVAACGANGLVERDDWSSLALADQVQFVQAAWQQPLPRLLVFDNCEDEQVLRAWRPTSGGCRVLLTSRRALWSNALGMATLALGELPRAESVAMLRQYRPDLPRDAYDLDALAAALGNLPLALHLAGSYLEVYQHDPPFGDPAHLVRELRATDVLDHEAMQGIDVAPSSTDHELHVGKTFAISLQRLDTSDSVDLLARAMLRRAGYLAPGTPYPRAVLLTALGSTVMKEDAERPMLRAVRRLIDLGLLGEANAMLTIHPLVAAFARRVAGPDNAQAAVEQALEAISEQYYIADDTQTLRALLPHLRHCTDAALQRNDEAAARLCNMLPFLLEVAGDSAGGVVYLEHAYAMLQHIGALTTALGGEVLNNLGTWHRDLGNLDCARRYHEQALALRQQIPDLDPADLGQSWHNLAEVLRLQGAIEEARNAYEHALAIWELRQGPHAPDVLAVRNGLALLQLEQGAYSDAQFSFMRLLSDVTAVLGKDNTRTAFVQRNLARTLHAQGQLTEARGHFNAALQIFRAKLGEHHLETLTVLYQLAMLDRDDGFLSQAREALQQVMVACEQTVGLQHPLPQRARVALEEVTG